MSVRLIVSSVPGTTLQVVLTRLVMVPAAFGGGGS
jgi:hypothetical protein